MPWCPKCLAVYPELTSECPNCACSLLGRRPLLPEPEGWPAVSLDLMVQTLCVLVGLVVAGIIATAMMMLDGPIVNLVAVPGIVLFPAAALFALSSRFHTTFTALGLGLGWLIWGGLLFLISRSGNPDPATTWQDAILFLFAIPSVGTLTCVCGAKYGAHAHWKYIALPGAWLGLVTYAYALYDYYAYCGRL